MANLPSWEQNMNQPYLKGLGVASGAVTGKVLMLTDFTGELSAIPDGSILVIKKIMPQHIPLLHHVAGINYSRRRHG